MAYRSIGSYLYPAKRLWVHVLIGHVESDLRLQIVDRVILDDRYAELERESGIFRQLASDSGIEGEEQTAGLAGDRVTVIDPDVGAWVEGQKPFVGKAEVEGRCELQVADIFPGRIARETDVVADHRFEIARRADLPQRVAKAGGGHDLPLFGAERVSARGRDKASAKADRPALVQIVDDDSPDIGIADAIEVVPLGIAGRDGILGDQRQIGAQRQNPPRRQIQ